MSEELEKCPFCGDTYIKTYRSRAGYQVGCNTVNCIACHAYVRAYKTEKEAVEAWNRRESAQPEIVFCKDCKHRPIEKNGEIMPPKEDDWDDWECPCLCDDYFYSWRPKDNFFCASGERREG